MSCQFNECKNRAKFSIHTDSPKYCETHKSEGMVITLRRKRCIECKSVTGVGYGSVSNMKQQYCKPCGRSRGMINLNGTRCRNFKVCKKMASFGLPNTKKHIVYHVKHLIWLV